MALIICSECGKRFSDRAPACPECGCPTEIILAEVEEDCQEVAITKPVPVVQPTEIIDKKNRVVYKSYYILGNTYSFTLEEYHGLTIEATLENLKRLYRTSAEKDFKNANSMEHLFQMLQKNTIDIINTSTYGIIQLFMQNDILSVDEETFINRYFSEFDISTVFQPVVDAYSRILGAESEINQYYEELRHSRGSKWSGGGFGVKGALQGYMQAQMMNAGNLLLHSIGDSTSRNADQRKINQLKDDLLNSEEVKQAVIQVYDNLFAYTRNGLKTECVRNGYASFFNRNEEESNSILNNLTKIHETIDDERVDAFLLKVFEADPLNVNLYHYLVVNNIMKDDLQEFEYDIGLDSTVNEILSEFVTEEFLSITLQHKSPNEDLQQYVIYLISVMDYPNHDTIRRCIEYAFGERAKHKSTTADMKMIETWLDILWMDSDEEKAQILKKFIIDDTDANIVERVVTQGIESALTNGVFASDFHFPQRERIDQIPKISEFRYALQIPTGEKILAIYCTYNWEKKVPKCAFAIWKDAIAIYDNTENEGILDTINWRPFIEQELHMYNSGFDMCGKIYSIPHYREIYDLLFAIYHPLKRYYENPDSIKVTTANDKQNKVNRQFVECSQALKEFLYDYASEWYRTDNIFRVNYEHIVASYGIEIPIRTFRDIDFFNHLPDDTIVYIRAQDSIILEKYVSILIITQYGIFWGPKLQSKGFISWSDFLTAKIDGLFENNGVRIGNQVFATPNGLMTGKFLKKFQGKLQKLTYLPENGGTTTVSSVNSDEEKPKTNGITTDDNKNVDILSLVRESLRKFNLFTLSISAGTEWNTNMLHNILYAVNSIMNYQNSLANKILDIDGAVYFYNKNLEKLLALVHSETGDFATETKNPRLHYYAEEKLRPYLEKDKLLFIYNTAVFSRNLSEGWAMSSEAFFFVKRKKVVRVALTEIREIVQGYADNTIKINGNELIVYADNKVEVFRSLFSIIIAKIYIESQNNGIVAFYDKRKSDIETNEKTIKNGYTYTKKTQKQEDDSHESVVGVEARIDNKQEKPLSEYRFCNYCGQKIKRSSKFCNHCGKKLN